MIRATLRILPDFQRLSATRPITAQPDFIQIKPKLEERLEYTFKSDDLLREALHAGEPKLFGQHYAAEGNKPLAVIGDAGVRTASAKWCYERNLSKGKMSEVHDSLATDKNWAGVGFRYDIHKCLTVQPGTTAVSARMMATAMEAILGAVLMDSGARIEAVEAAMLRLGYFDTVM